MCRRYGASTTHSKSDGSSRNASGGPGDVPAGADSPADLKPDPLTSTTSSELVARLREYREWAGEPPFRKIAAQARQKVAHSTIFTALTVTAMSCRACRWFWPLSRDAVAGRRTSEHSPRRGVG